MKLVDERRDDKFCFDNNVVGLYFNSAFASFLSSYLLSELIKCWSLLVWFSLCMHTYVINILLICSF